MTSSTIRRVSWRGFAVPFREPFATSRETFVLRHGLLVFVETSHGQVGLGEASPLPDNGTLQGGSVRALEAIAHRTLGTTPTDAWTDPPCELPGGDRLAVAAARCGFETAIADLAARADGRPLASWLAAVLGLHPGPNTVPVNAVLGEGPPTALHMHAAALARSGFETFKVKVGGDPAIDAARVAAVREAVGPAATIRVDANQAWTFHEALSFFGAARATRIALCEEPLRAGPANLSELARLRHEGGVPIAVDESCLDTAALRRVIASGAADAIVIKPMLAGLREALAMLRLARDAHLQVIVTSTFDAGPGVTSAAHLASLLPAPQPASGLATLALLEDDLVDVAPHIDHGRLHLPSRPGLGVLCDTAALRRYATGIEGSVGE